MAKTALELTPEERRGYRPAAAIAERKKRSDSRGEEHWLRARRVAQEAAKLLREEFGADRVFLFGSLVHPSWFTVWSDIDLAVRGVPPDRYFSAVATVTGMSPDFQIDLVDLDNCRSDLRTAIERDGIVL
jgi:predicted nucleotidyltransferase